MTTVSHDQDGFTYVQYADDKRPLKIGVYVIDDEDRNVYLSHLIDFVESIANAPQHIAKMEPVNYWRLVERLATMFCREFSPTANWNVSKPEIRGMVCFVLAAGVHAGHWPVDYEISDETFVQYGGGYDEQR